MKSLTIGRLLLNGDHITGLGCDLDDARLAAAAQARGIAAKLYSGKAEGQLIELARQLARMRTDEYVLAVMPGTAEATAKLAHSLRRLRPNATCLFWGDATTLARLRDIGSDDRAVEVTALEAAATLLLPANVDYPPSEIIPSPYLTGLLPPEALGRLGLTARQNSETFAEEVRWASDQPLPDSTVVSVDATGCDAARVLDFCTLTAGLKRSRFALRLDAASCTHEVGEVLASLGLARVLINGAETRPSSLGAATTPIELLNDPAIEKLALAYGRNGFVVMHTGTYFDARTPGIQHLEVPAAMSREDRQAVYSWADDNMLIRSAAILNGPAELTGAVAVELAEIETAETGGWPKHSYIVAHGGAGQASVTFDGQPKRSLSTRYVPLMQLDDAVFKPEEIVTVTIREVEDVVELERRLIRFHTEGVVQVPHPASKMIYENSCRWLSYGACKLTMLRRLQVDLNGHIRNCRDSGHVGQVGESYDRMLIGVRQLEQLETVRRGCATCVARDSCSHCTQLPETWANRYCDLRNAYPLTALFFELSAFPMVLRDHMLPIGPMLTLSVSGENLSNLHYVGPIGPAPRDGRQLIVSLGGEHYVWWRGSRRSIKLSSPLAAMAEAWWAGSDKTTVVAFLSDRFSVSVDVAASSYTTGMERLRSAGVIND